jgi:putative hydrolase of the HAD superfamily
MPIRAVVFDIGGVFFPWPTTEYFLDWGERRGLARDGLAERLWHGPDIEAANLGEITAEEYARRCAARVGTDQAEVYALVEHCFGGDLNEELLAYARTLKPAYRVAALTNTWSFGRSVIERRDLGSLFDLIVSSAEEGVRKPNPRIYEILIGRLGVEPEEVVFVDDIEENIEAARMTGMHAVHFVSTRQAVAELGALLRPAPPSH